MNSNNTFKFISSLCKQSYMQPKVVEEKMRKHFESISKYQNKLWTRNTLQILIDINVGTNEIQIHAIKQVKHMNSKNVVNKFYRIIYDNMLTKVEDALENEETAKNDMIQSCIELKQVVKMSTITGYEYKCYLCGI